MGFGLVLVGLIAGAVSGAWIVMFTGSVLLALLAISVVGTSAVLIAAVTIDAAMRRQDECEAILADA